MVWAAVTLDPDAPIDLRPWVEPDEPLRIGNRLSGPAAARWLNGSRPTHLLVLTHSEQQRSAKFFANVVSGALPWLPVAVVVADASSIAITALARRAQLEQQPATVAAALVPRWAREVRSGAYLRSVTKLRSPSPSFGQHVRSLFPGKGFVAELSPDARVVNPSAVESPAPGGVMLVDRPAESTEVTALGRLSAGQALFTVPEATKVGNRYGSRGVEYVVLPEHLSMTPPRGRCSVCQQPLLSSYCPFCHARMSVFGGSHQ